MVLCRRPLVWRARRDKNSGGESLQEARARAGSPCKPFVASIPMRLSFWSGTTAALLGRAARRFYALSVYVSRRARPERRLEVRRRCVLAEPDLSSGLATAIRGFGAFPVRTFQTQPTNSPGRNGLAMNSSIAGSQTTGSYCPERNKHLRSGRNSLALCIIKRPFGPPIRLISATTRSKFFCLNLDNAVSAAASASTLNPAARRMSPMVSRTSSSSSTNNMCNLAADTHCALPRANHRSAAKVPEVFSKRAARHAPVAADDGKVGARPDAIGKCRDVGSGGRI
jgi:hypothetical protein